jgi:hypothetical protein
MVRALSDLTPLGRLAFLLEGRGAVGLVPQFLGFVISGVSASLREKSIIVEA